MTSEYESFLGQQMLAHARREGKVGIRPIPKRPVHAPMDPAPVYDALTEPMTVREIVNAVSGMSPQMVADRLAMLGREGRAERVPGVYPATWRRV